MSDHTDEPGSLLKAHDVFENGGQLTNEGAKKNVTVQRHVRVVDAQNGILQRFPPYK
jgi:hypothetical protein